MRASFRRDLERILIRCRRFATDTSKVGKTALLTDACLVIDGLGDDAKYALFFACRRKY